MSRTLMLSSLMLRNWSTDLSVPVMHRSFLSSTVTSATEQHHTNRDRQHYTRGRPYETEFIHPDL